MDAGAHVAHRHGIDLDLGVFFTSLSTHFCAVSHELGLVFLELGVLDEALVLSDAALLEAAENEDGKADSNDTADGGDDGDLRS